MRLGGHPHALSLWLSTRAEQIRAAVQGSPRVIRTTTPTARSGEAVPPPIDMSARIREARAEVKRVAGLSWHQRIAEATRKTLDALRPVR